MARRRDRTAGADQVPGYGDIAEIGSGAFATVYRATEADTGRQVALKVLKVDTIHPHLVETFYREIQTLAKVSDHPNIVTLYRPVTTPDGRPVLVLELCRESLAERIRRGGPLGARDMSRIGIKIAGALETAHRAGFLHRDMKPQNILVTQFGEPALGDFGVAALQTSAQATAGVFGFTTLHAAPEVLEGNHLSPATDVYGLASTMYQALSGVAPFATFENEAPASVILRIIRDPVRPIRSHEIPLELSDLLEAALAKDPAGRPATAAEFAEALNRIEVTNGWPTTAFVAWGEARPAPAPGPGPGGEEPNRLPAPPPLPARTDGPKLHPSAPSVVVADVAHARPVIEPATGAPAIGQPAIGQVPAAEAAGPRGGAPLVPAPGTVPPAPVPAETLVPEPEAQPAPAAAEAVPAIPRPPEPVSWTLPPPPPPRRRGPGLAAPAETPRNVVAPGARGRGQQGPPVPAGGPPLLPLQPPGTGAEPASPRPRFVDPPPVPGTAAGGRGAAPGGPRVAASTYEQTIVPAARVRPPARPAGPTPVGGAGLDRARLAWMAVIGAAAVIVLLAVLLLAGVL